MSVTRTTEVFLNKCRNCANKWRAMAEVDIIDWYNDTSSIAYPVHIECPKCRKMSKVNKYCE